MADDTSPFRQVESEYTKRLVAAVAFIAAAAVSGRLLYSGATTHWVIALLVLCVAASIGGMLTLDVIQRFYQMRRQALIADAPKLYGYAGPEPVASAVEKLKRTRKTPPKDVH